MERSTTIQMFIVPNMMRLQALVQRATGLIDPYCQLQKYKYM